MLHRRFLACPGDEALGNPEGVVSTSLCSGAGAAEGSLPLPAGKAQTMLTCCRDGSRANAVAKLRSGGGWGSARM
eukprot:5308573-Alexandrium_andersonii.AAC.1